MLFFSNLLGQIIDFGTIVSSSDLIVEGQVIEQTSFWNKNKTQIQTKNRILVSQIYKGIIENSIIYITTQGGYLEEEFVIVPHSAQLSLNDKGIFLCTLNEDDPEKNIRVSYGEMGIFLFPKNKADGPIISRNNFFLNKEILINSLSNKLEIGNINELGRIVKEPCDEIITFENTETEISLSFSQPTFSNNGLTVEFDILASTNSDGLKFGKADLFIQYSTAPFGENVIDNGRLEMTEGELINNNNYELI